MMLSSGLFQSEPDPVTVHHIEPTGFTIEAAGEVWVAAEGNHQGFRLLDPAQLSQDSSR